MPEILPDQRFDDCWRPRTVTTVNAPVKPMIDDDKYSYYPEAVPKGNRSKEYFNQQDSRSHHYRDYDHDYHDRHHDHHYGYDRHYERDLPELSTPPRRYHHHHYHHRYQERYQYSSRDKIRERRNKSNRESNREYDSRI